MSVIKPLSWEEFSRVWNEHFPHKAVTQANRFRRANLFMRSDDEDWLATWKQVIAKAAESTYLRVASWFVADFVLQDKNGYSIRILEGEFSDERQRDGLGRNGKAARRAGGPQAAAGDFDGF
jgi:hypothetical protein